METDAVPAARPPGEAATPDGPAQTDGPDQTDGPGQQAPGHQHVLAPDPQPVTVLEDLLTVRGEGLLRAAIMLAGSHADGEDLLQAALERVYRHWGRIDGDPEGYLRRTLYHLAADGWRRQGILRTRLRLLRPPAEGPDETSAVDRRDELIRLLRHLSPRQRTAVILRYWEELSEAETARLMGCSVGTVKSAASRGLSRLRELSITHAPTQDTGRTS
jgi:RNA polymerase sigma-70 factor (sigma-E family)